MDLAEDAGLAGRAEVWDIRQLLSAAVYQGCLFQEARRTDPMAALIQLYNQIVRQTETDPSLRIEFEAR